MAKSKSSANYYKPELAALILRLGIAAVFLYAAIDSFREPAAWTSFIPHFLTKLLAAKTLLDLISLLQIFLALLLVWGKYIGKAAAVSAMLFAGIIIFNTSSFLITFRDMGLLAAALALFFLDK